MNTRKAAGPDGVSGRMLKTCANQLAQVFPIFSLYPGSMSTIHTCLKASAIVLVSHKCFSSLFE